MLAAPFLTQLHLTLIVGARPNYMKIAALVSAAARTSRIATSLVHTGQHYDPQLSGVFFTELRLPRPDVYLGVGSGSHAVQTARVMEAFDAVLDQQATDVVVVVGDVNSTFACALVAAKRGVAVAHVEAGLRSRDRTMPEEINRVLTDQISDHLFITEPSAAANLAAEGVAADKIHFVGNVMIDTLLRHRAEARERPIVERLGLTVRSYALCTLHRPSNVDSPEAAANAVCGLELLSRRLPVVFPIHPRTRKRLAAYGLLGRLETNGGVRIVDPVGYLDCVALMDQARMVLTDSGGIQEETTALGVPCLTFRENTERPITITEGTNRLVGTDPLRVAAAADEVLSQPETQTQAPERWDGRAGDRIIDVLQTRIADGRPATPEQPVCQL